MLVFSLNINKIILAYSISRKDSLLNYVIVNMHDYLILDISKSKLSLFVCLCAGHDLKVAAYILVTTCTLLRKFMLKVAKVVGPLILCLEAAGEYVLMFRMRIRGNRPQCEKSKQTLSLWIRYWLYSIKNLNTFIFTYFNWYLWILERLY